MTRSAITTFLILAAALPRVSGAPASAAAEWVRSARASIESKSYPEAAAICERGMRAEPNSDEIEAVYLSLPPEILAARWADRYERARRSNDVRELIALGRALSGIDSRRKTEAPYLARGLLARAIHLEPGNASAWFHYGRALRNNGTPEEMFAAWERALSLQPDDALRVQIYTWIGKQRSVLSQPEPAGAAFAAAHKINRQPVLRQPRWAWEYFGFLHAQSRGAEARTLLAEILRWSPGFVPAVLERARLSAARQAWTPAIRDAQYVLHYAAGNVELERGAHALLARAYHVLNQEPDARVHQAWIEAHPR